MNTPITDASEMTGFPNPTMAAEGWVTSDTVRRLELDRAALMEALEKQLEAERLEAEFNHVSMVVFMKDAFERTEVDAYKVQEAKEAMDVAKSRALSLRETALSTARANFP